MSLREWYKGRSILISGGSGFMGKVLIEKVLRSCTDIDTIYLICRSKRGLNPQTRVADFAKLPLFERLRKENPSAFKKLVAVEGDLTQEGLGIRLEARNEIISKVSVVFNFAASLKLEAGMKDIVEHNTRGTLRMLEFAKELPKLEVFLHLSTAFCHCEFDILEETIYQPPANPHDILDAMNWMDAETADLITPKLLGVHPNCYTYTKRLAEGLMKEYEKTLPIVVCRPAIVSPSVREPVPGWVDNLNGPVGVLVAASKGVLRSMLCHAEHNAEVIPVDICINIILVAAWRRAIEPSEEIPVYNISGSQRVPVQWGALVERGKAIMKDYPLDPGLWYPGGTMRTNPYTHALAVFFFQVVPAYFIDFILLIAQQKRFMVRVQNRILLGTKLLQYFTMRNWNFPCSKLMNMPHLLDIEEREIFYTSNVNINVDDYIKDMIIGARLYILKEPLENQPRARKIHMVMFWLHIFCQFLFYALLVYYLLPYVMNFKGYLDTRILTPVATN